jgi:hypothetical protein
MPLTPKQVKGIVWLSGIVVVGCGLIMVVMCLALALPGLKSTPTQAPGPGVTTLWPDVPVFPGSEPDLKTNTFFNQKPSNPNSLSVAIRYTTQKSLAEAGDFYSNELMKSTGWTPKSIAIVSHDSPDGTGPTYTLGHTNPGCTYDAHFQSLDCLFSRIDSQGNTINLRITGNVFDGQSILNFTRTNKSLQR